MHHNGTHSTMRMCVQNCQPLMQRCAHAAAHTELHGGTLLAGNLGVGPPPTSASTLHLNSSSTMPIPPLLKGLHIYAWNAMAQKAKLQTSVSARAASCAWHNRAWSHPANSTHRLLKRLAIVHAKAAGRATGEAFRVLVEAHPQQRLWGLRHVGAAVPRRRWDPPCTELKPYSLGIKMIFATGQLLAQLESPSRKPNLVFSITQL